MNSDLPATGTAELLELLAPFVPDDFIDPRWPTAATGGRRREYTAAQLYRVHLLSLRSPVHSWNLLVQMLPEQRAWRKFAGLRRQTQVPGVRVRHEFRARRGVAGLRQSHAQLLQPVIDQYAWRERSVGLIDAPDLPAAGVGFKKKHRPILRGRSRSGWTHAPDRAEPLLRRRQKAHPPFVAARLPRRRVAGSVGQLGNVSEGGLLVPSRHYCQQPWAWGPPLVVADMGYLAAEAKRRCRERWQVAVRTKLRRDMKLVAPDVAWNQAVCPQGEPRTWLGYDGDAQEHWLGTGAAPELCVRCWEAARGPRQFAYRAEAHETLLGLLPLASLTAQRVLRQVRPWIEPAQSYEKNQLGLGQVFRNGLRLTGAMALLADAAVLLRARVLLGRPVPPSLLAGLMPTQLPLGLKVEEGEGFSPEKNSQPQNLQ